MNRVFDLWSDVASLHIFDPSLFEGCEAEFAQFPFHRIEAVREGRACFIHLGGDGTFKVRVTDEDWPLAEKQLIHHSLYNLGLVTESGKVFISGMDQPGDSADAYTDARAGFSFDLPAGEWNLDFHLLHLWKVRDEDASQLPDYVVVLRRRQGAFVPLSEEPLSQDLTDDDIAEIIAEVEAERSAKESKPD